MTEEVGKSVSVRNAKPDAEGKIRSEVLYRIDGAEDVDGKELLQFEMHRAGVVTNTDLLSVDEHGIVCWARINVDGEFIKLNPPQTIIATPLKRSATWNFNGQAGDLKVRQHYKVTGEEDINVPAGRFRAFHIHAEQTLPSLMTIDRWFALDTGIVKDVTSMRAVWIAENIGEDFPPDCKVDEASAIAESPTAHGVFTLSRPEDGWAPGDYRLEFYVDDVFIDAVKLRIAK